MSEDDELDLGDDVDRWLDEEKTDRRDEARWQRAAKLVTEQMQLPFVA